MNQSTFQLLGNVASADFYLCEGSDITLISDNNAYNMKALAQEALKLRVPNSLTVIDLNNFYVGMIPIDHNQILTMIPHINTTIIHSIIRKSLILSGLEFLVLESISIPKVLGPNLKSH